MVGVYASFTLRFGHFVSDHAVAKIRDPPDVPDTLSPGTRPRFGVPSANRGVGAGGSDDRAGVAARS